MKKIFLAALAPFFLLSQSAFAVLPPLWQGIFEMSAILNSKEIKEYFSSGDQIREIVKGEDNTYAVRSMHSACLVKVNYHPTDRIGPADFTLTFEAVEPQQ